MDDLLRERDLRAAQALRSRVIFRVPGAESSALLSADVPTAFTRRRTRDDESRWSDRDLIEISKRRGGDPRFDERRRDPSLVDC